MLFKLIESGNYTVFNMLWSNVLATYPSIPFFSNTTIHEGERFMSISASFVWDCAMSGLSVILESVSISRSLRVCYFQKSTLNYTFYDFLIRAISSVFVCPKTKWQQAKDKISSDSKRITGRLRLDRTDERRCLSSWSGIVWLFSR